MRFRLSVMAWLGIWAVLAALQAYALGSAMAAADAGGAGKALWIGLAVLLQFVKLPFAAGRLNDLGRPIDDAILGLVPVVNLGLWSQLTRRTPSEKRRDALVSAREAELSAWSAFKSAGWVLPKTLPVVVPAILVGGLASGAVDTIADQFLAWAAATPAEAREPARQALWGLAGVLGVYGLLQLAKRRTASRGSWIPMLLLLPTALLALTLQLQGSRDLGMVVVSLPYQALDLLWGCFMGGMLAVVWSIAADRAGRGEPVTWGAVLEAWQQRGIGVVAVHGGVYQFVFVGLQVLVPGIHYALYYAFADFHALFEPEKPALARAGQTFHGLRKTVFKAHYLGILIYAALSLVGWSVLSDPSKIMASMFDPGEVPTSLNYLLGIAWVLAVAWIKLTLYALWRDRMRAEAAATAG